MTPEVQTALSQLRREIEILSASIVARNRLATPEILTPQRVFIGADRAAIRISEPANDEAENVEVLAEPAPIPALNSRIDPRDRIEPVAMRSGKNEKGFLLRLLAFTRRIMRVFQGRQPSP